MCFFISEAGNDLRISMQGRYESMKVSVIGRQMTVSDDLKARVEKKLAKFDKFFPDGAEAHAAFSKVREIEKLEITISYKGTLFRSEEKAKTFENALDQCVENIERQIRKNKTRLERRMKEGSLGELEPADGALDIPADDDDKDFIRVKEFDLKPMSADEAILQMDLLEHNFFVFNDAETDQTCVVYKRNDGGYGLIVPKK